MVPSCFQSRYLPIYGYGQFDLPTVKVCDVPGLDRPATITEFWAISILAKSFNNKTAIDIQHLPPAHGSYSGPILPTVRPL
jgi:hypothetical protein